MRTSLAVLAVCLVGALAKPRLLKAPSSGFVIDKNETQHDNDFDPSNETSKSVLNCMVEVEGDILIPCEQLQPQQKTTSDVGRVKKGAPTLSKYWWPKGIIYYSYAGDTIPPIFVRAIRAAMAEWERFTCVRFKFSKKSKNRVVLRPYGGCTSEAGMIGGPQNLFLGYQCKAHGTVLHELGHAIGLLHEHKRPDRTGHVIINHGNIKDRQWTHRQFIKDTWNEVENIGLPYDYDSIMHYGQYAWSKNGRKTITTKHRGHQHRIGQRIGLSYGDVRTVSRMYGCADHCRLSDGDCPRGGFVNKDCRCVCPGRPGQPIKDCYDTKVFLPSSILP